MERFELADKQSFESSRECYERYVLADNGISPSYVVSSFVEKIALGFFVAFVVV